MKRIVLCAVVFVLIIVVTASLLTNREKFVPPFEAPMWAYWESPDNTFPEIVQRCYDNWKKVGHVKDVRIITPDNVESVMSRSEWKKIQLAADGEPAVISDLVALYLLKTYGGLTSDSTVYMNSPLNEWFQDATSKKEAFLFNASRYNADGTVCPETFFMYSRRKGHPFFKTWYYLACQVGKDGKEGRDRFIAKIKREYPRIAERMSEDYYLWVYLVGKYLIKKNPDLINNISFLDSEKDPLKILSSVEWETDPACKILDKPQSTKLTKLDNDLWKTCDPSIVPIY